MNPSEIPAWLEQHGGADGPPQTDANGVTTHRARDGSYVNVFNGRVTMIGHGAPLSVDEQGAAPAQAQRQGAGMTQQELEAIINGWGANLGAGDFREEVKQEDVPNPAAYDENGQYIQGTPLTVKGPVTYRTWVKPGTNQRLTVKVNQDGTYTKVYDGADSGIKPEAQQSGTKEGDTRGPQNGPKREVYRNGQWVVEDNPLYRPDESTTRPQTVSTNTTEPFIVTRMPDGTLKTEKNPNYKGPEQKPGTVLTIKGGDGKTYLVPIDAQGNPGPARDSGVPGEGNQPLPAGMPRFTPDPNKPALGLVEYAEQLAALRASGKLTDKQYQEFVGYAHQQASTEAQRLDTITRAQQTQQTNEINQRTTDMQLSSNRLTAANSATQNALDTSLKMAGNFTNDTYRSAGGPILPAVMALQDMRAASWGGMNTPPPVTTAGYPALQQVGQMGLTPAQQPNTVIPAVSALAPGAPGAPAAAPARPPLWQPRTNMPTPNPPPAAPVAPGQSPPAAPVQNPALVNTDPHDGATPVAVPPAAPAQPAPAPSSPFVGGSVLPQPPDQMPVPVPYPTSPGAVSMQQPGVLPAVNTLGIAAEVAAAGGYSPEVMQQAMRELGFM